jgi:NhaP-type Na+/H+ or K+/H+ antiporter
LEIAMIVGAATRRWRQQFGRLSRKDRRASTKRPEIVPLVARAIPLIVKIRFLPPKELTPKHQPISRRRRVLASLLALIGTITISTAGFVESEYHDHRFHALLFVGFAFSVTGFVLHFRREKMPDKVSATTRTNE